MPISPHLFSMPNLFSKSQYIVLWLYAPLALAQSPIPSQGTIRRFEQFQSQYVTARHVDVWLPEHYSPKHQYAVLYMNDGQMLYDSTTTWNKQEWGVDETMTKLQKQRIIKDCIVVGVWNADKGRHAEYFPQKPYESLSQPQKDYITSELQTKGRTKDAFKPVSDHYLKFLVMELKPFIDKTFSTKTDPQNTFIAGSSMGGLISMYALCEYPQVFGGAACLSTHWPGIFSTENNPIPQAFLSYLQTHLPSPPTHKIYFDYGNKTLDALYPPLQKQVDEVMKAKGFQQNNWQTHFFDGDDHSEKAWKNRLHLPLIFLLGQ